MKTTIDYLLNQQTYDYAVANRTYVFNEFIIYQSVEQVELATCKGYLQVRYQEPV